MPIQKIILICLVFASALFGSVLAADKPSTQADVDKLQEQVRTLDKELVVQREAFVRKLDDVEKRQSEITAQQANSLAVIANQTATVGNHITNTSILITVLYWVQVSSLISAQKVERKKKLEKHPGYGLMRMR